MRAGFEGGQMPIYMRLGKQRGSTSADAMPVGPHRTRTYAVNVSDLERFDAGTEITPESLKEAGVIRHTKHDLKILGHGDLSKKLTVRVHAISATAREKIEAAGGTVELLKEPKVKTPKRKETAATAAAETTAAAEEKVGGPDASVDVVEATATDVSEEGESS